MVTPGDVDDFHRILGDPLLHTYLPSPPDPPREKVEAGVKRMVGHWNERGFGTWLMAHKERGETFGYCGLRFLPETEEVEILYGITSPYYRQGLTTEAAKASVRFGFEEAKLERIIALAHPENTGSRRVMEKAGLKYVKQARYFDMDCLYYALTRDEFEPDDSLYILRS